MKKKPTVKGKSRPKKTIPAAKKSPSQKKAPAFTSKRAWKLVSSKRWPPPDEPMMRHQESQADLIVQSAPEIAAPTRTASIASVRLPVAAQSLAGLRLAALDHSQNIAEPKAEPMAQPMNLIAAAGPVAPQLGGNNWVPLGPMAIPNGQTYTAARVLVSGRVTAIVSDPTAPDTIYLGTALGGVWKTTDGGLNWDPTGDNEVSLAIGALALDPNFPQIVYAGTGEGNFSQDSYYGAGILKSTNGGNTWTSLGLGTLQGLRFSRIVVTPSTGAPATQLFAATTGGTGNPGGLFRSLNAGLNWAVLGAGSGLPTGSATDVAMDPLSPNTIYVAFANRGIYKSTNANAATPTFTQLTSGLPVATAAAPNGVFRITLAISPSSPQTVYALMCNNDATNYPDHSGAPYNYAIDKFYVTTDGGTSWASIALPGPVTDGIGGQGFYNLAVNVDPTTPDIVYLSGISLWKAVRSGAAWTITDIGGAFHGDNHALAFRPGDHLTLLAGSDGGIYKSSNGGGTWSDSLNKGLCLAQFEFIDQHPTSTAVVFGGTQDNGTEQYRGNPVFTHADEGDGGCVVINQNNPTNVVSTYYSPSPKLSTQGGDFGTWLDVSPGIGGTDALFYPPMTASATDPNALAIGTTVVNLDPAQGTGGWPIKVTLPGLAAGEKISTIDYVDASLIYAATTLGKVFKLVLAGSTWSAALISAPPLPTTYAWDISPLPGAPNTVVVVFSGFGISHVWRGVVPVTGVAAWTNISGTGTGVLPDIPVSALVIDPINAARMFIGTDVGVFETQNSGTTWSSISSSSSFSTGLPNCAVFDLRLHESTRILRAATHGRGLWEKLADAPSSPAVDMYVRDHVMETARILPTPNNVPATFDDPLRYVALGDTQWWWMCADIKVDALEGAVPAFQMPVSAVDYVAFESKLQHRQPQRTRVNRVYVQLHNRGFQAAAGVNVKILWADASAGLPNLPPDFWTAFPGDSSNVSQWHPVGTAQTVASLKAARPIILEWDWTPPASAAEHTCMLVVMDSVSDPIPAANKVFDLGTLVPNEKRVGLKNLQIIDPTPSAGGAVMLNLNTRGKNAQTLQIIPHGAATAKLTLVFPKGAVPAAAKLAGLTPKALSNNAIRTLTQKYGQQAVAGFDTAKVFALISFIKGGELTAALRSPTTGVIVVIEGAGPSSGGAAFSIVQREQDTITGGSTFAFKKK